MRRVLAVFAAALAATQPPATPPLQYADLVYVGAFRVPAEPSGADSFSFGGMPIAYNPSRNSLFVGSRAGRLAEITIPDPVDSAAIGELSFATFVQPFADPTEGHLQEVATDRANAAAIDGLMVSGDRLYGTAFVYYDASGSQRLSHYSRSVNLAEPSFKGMYQVGDLGAGFVSGYLAAIPPEWQAALGGVAITGQCCIPIVSRTSYGPAAFAWNPRDLGVRSPAPAAPLFYYPGDHPLSAWEGTSPIYNGTTEIHGAVIPAGARTLLLIGRHGVGRFCYGDGGANGPCADPVSADKGTHAYPYRYQLWAYDLLDLADVKAGRRRPWDVRPYAVWPLDLPIDEASKHLGGATYDPANRLLYISQTLADRDEYAYRPLIHVFRTR